MELGDNGRAHHDGCCRLDWACFASWIISRNPGILDFGYWSRKLLWCVIIHRVLWTLSIVAISLKIHLGIGWKNCRRLSDNGVINADSYAHFGLGKWIKHLNLHSAVLTIPPGAKFINPADGTAPQRPMEDGSLEALAVSGGKGRRQYHIESSSNATRYTWGSKAHSSNNVNIPFLRMATLSPGNVSITSTRSWSSILGSPNLSSSTRMPAVNTADPTGTTTLVVPRKVGQHDTNSETGLLPLISGSNLTRPSSYNTLPSPPRYNALKKTDRPKTTDGMSNTKAPSRCADIQTAKFCVVSLAVITPTDASTVSTKTVNVSPKLLTTPG